MLLAPHAQGKVAADPIFSIAGRARAAGKQRSDVIDASIGIMLDDRAEPWIFETPERVLREMSGAESSPYSPFLGLPGFRRAISEMVPAPPGMGSTVVATPGATGAIFLAMVSYLSPEQRCVVHRPGWVNYPPLAIEHGRGVELFDFLDESDRFDTEVLVEKMAALRSRQGRVMAVINTPAHNPSGYTLDDQEWADLARGVRTVAEPGDPVILLFDAAYMEFARDPDKERRFVDRLLPLPDNVVVTVAWSGSKSYTKYGYRLGALVAMCGDKREIPDFEGAAAILARGTWSNAPRPGMAMVEAIHRDPEASAALAAERTAVTRALQERHRLFTGSADLPCMPYHAGFFTVVRHPDPEEAAEHLARQGVFVVPMDLGLRVALSSVPAEQIPRLARALAATPGLPAAA